MLFCYVADVVGIVTLCCIGMLIVLTYVYLLCYVCCLLR